MAAKKVFGDLSVGQSFFFPKGAGVNGIPRYWDSEPCVKLSGTSYAFRVDKTSPIWNAYFFTSPNEADVVALGAATRHEIDDIFRAIEKTKREDGHRVHPSFFELA